MAPLVVVLGPTGSGKSELALRIAEEFGGEIVNCDSLQLYRHMNIGTAKLPPGQRRGIPHHLLDILDPDQVFTAGEYARLARPVLREIADRGRLPVVAGGTGFYVRALLEGLFPGPPRDPALRERLAAREKRRPGSLHRILSRLDPPSAARIHAPDVQKLIRALEIVLLTRRPLDDCFAQGRDPLTGFEILKLALDPPRAELFARLDLRSERMFSGGLVQEVEGLLRMGFPRDSKAFEAVGYRQALDVLEGRLSLEEALALTQRNTRRYAKRQWTWFRGEKNIVWIQGFGDQIEAQEQTHAEVGRFFHKKLL